jgi:DNA-binding transcriptional regulator YdaS (Cro superfamily)
MRTENLSRAIKLAGGVSALARKLGIKPQAISQWEDVPAQRILEIEVATGMPREELRPDLYRKTPASQAASGGEAA